VAGQPAAAATPTGLSLSRFTSHAAVVQLIERTRAEETVRRVLELERPGDLPDLVVQITLAPAGPGRRLFAIQDLRSDAALERRRRSFVANASHELKTPIAALIGLLDLIEELPKDAHADLLARAQRNAHALANMADDLLQLARAEDPDWRIRFEKVDVGAAVAEVCEELRARAEAKGLALCFEGPAAPLTLLSDHGAIQTVARNLISNAINYTAQGEVQVIVTKESAGASLTVRDTGPGIDPAILPQIFERFFRDDPAHSRASGGTGLGLAIVRNLLGRIGGRISVQSRPGEGSIFRVELPEQASRPLPGAGLAQFR
ncbi:MAG: HAMP domain-containing sensor histidine kinase, partial [Planctomycetota bacterium]|nr:HAMP domain-containing sensor histidine kinase [Planctomycetota bacterium]